MAEYLEVMVSGWVHRVQPEQPERLHTVVDGPWCWCCPHISLKKGIITHALYANRNRVIG